MTFRIILFTPLLALIEIQAKQLFPGQHVIQEPILRHFPSKSEETTQKRYETKEIILYLTPSQIRALQAGREPESILQPIQFQNDQQSNLQRHNEFVRQQFENIKAARIASYDEEPRNIPSYGNEELSSENQQKKLSYPDNGSYYQDRPEEQLKSDYLNYLAQLRKNNERKPEVERDALATYDLVAGKKQENRNYEQKNAIESDKFVRQHHQQQLGKQTQLAQAEAIAKLLPIFVHEEVKITRHHPVPIIRHVKVPVSPPVLIPASEGTELKVPHPYPIPFEIIKPVPMPIFEMETRVNRPIKILKQIP